MSKLTFRYATPADAPAVRDLIETVYRGAGARNGWTHELDLLETPRTRPDEVAGIIADPEQRFVLAVEGDALVACALIKKEEGDKAYFGMFAVRPSLQGGGVGGAVLAECEAHARALWSSRAMVMTVINLREELIAYYERRGFCRTGETMPFPFHIVPDEKRRDFHLVWLAKNLA